MGNPATGQSPLEPTPPTGEDEEVTPFSLEAPGGSLSMEELRLCKEIVQTPSPYQLQISRLRKLEGRTHEEKAYQLILEEIHKRASWQDRSDYVYVHALRRGLQLRRRRGHPWSRLLDGLAAHRGSRWPSKQRWIDYFLRFHPREWKRETVVEAYPRRETLLEQVAREAGRRGDSHELEKLLDSRVHQLHRQLALHWPLGKQSLDLFLEKSAGLKYLPFNPDFTQQMAQQSCQYLQEVVQQQGTREVGFDLVSYLEALEEKDFEIDGQLIFQLVEGIQYSSEERQQIQKRDGSDLRQKGQMPSGGREAVLQFLLAGGAELAQQILLDLWERVPKSENYVKPLIEHPAADTELWQRALQDWEQGHFSGQVFVEVPRTRQHPKVRERLRASDNAYVLSQLLEDLESEDFGLVLSRLVEEHPEIAVKELQKIQREDRKIPPGLVDPHDLAELLSHPDKKLREQVLRVLQGFEEVELPESAQTPAR